MSKERDIKLDKNLLQETKAQFARDDPAFLVLLAALLIISTAGFSFVLAIHFWGFIKFLIYVIFVDLIGVRSTNATQFVMNFQYNFCYRLE